MNRPNWDDFNKKNRDKTKAFEDMCRMLFLRKYKKNSYDYDYNINQAGLEFEPIFDIENKKWCGAQCKYFSEEANSTKYAQIYKSLKKAFKYYKGKLDVIIIYTNAQLEHICTEEELISIQNSDRINIVRDAQKNNIELVWMQADNITDTLIASENIDLLKLYFSDTREIDFCDSAISTNDRTFLNSCEFLDLKISNEITINMLHDDILKNKINLLIGAAGTGKSVAMKKLYLDFSLLFSKKYFEKAETESLTYIPILIKLRECINGNLETLVRERFRDYNLNYTESNYRYVYLFDGLDEVAYFELPKVISFISNLILLPQVKSIVISSRTDSNNISYVHQTIDCIEYKIDWLEKKHIKQFFMNKENSRKIDILNNLQNEDLLNDINDVFSIDLLWNNIEKIDGTTSKIEIVELSINHWINQYSKYNRLSVLEPKKKYILDICKEIAYNMQKRMSLTINLSEVQRIIINKYKQQSPNEINNIVEALIDLFFEKSDYRNLNAVLAFRHRRYQEYFLYLNIEEKFYTNPNILRELKLLPNRDFIIKIFLKTSLKRAEESRDIFKILSLRLFECYLGTDYIRNYKDEIIGRNYLFGISEAAYSYSKSFLHLLSTYTPKDLEILFDNKSLCISDAIKNENFPKFAEIYHRRNSVYIGELIKEKCELKEIKPTIKDIDSLYYFLYNVKKYPIDDLYNNEVKKVVITEEQMKHPDYTDSISTIISAFVKLALEFDVQYLTDMLCDMSNCILEIVCFFLCKIKNINILLAKDKTYSDFRNALIKRISGNDEKYFIHTLIIYTLTTEKDNKLGELTAWFEEINQRNYPSWSTNIEGHILLAIALKQYNKCALSEFKLGLDIMNTVLHNYNSKSEILIEWIKSIKKYNYIYDDLLMYSHSHILGELISCLNFDITQLKSFVRKLLRYDSVISIQCVMFSIFRNNPDLFDKIVNKSLLEKVFFDSMNNIQEEYDSYSESLFQYAAMFSKIDRNRKYYLLMSGVENSMIRPAYRNEELATMMMPSCLYYAHQNYWYDEYELESKCKKLYDVLMILNKTTDGAGELGCFKWIINHCLSNEFLYYELYGISEIPLYALKPVSTYNIDMVTLDNLQEYYSCRVNDAPYSSINFWRSIIELEYSHDKELSILYSVFDEYYYPSCYGYPIVEYIHIPTAILLSNENTKEKIVDYIIQRGGRYGLFNMVGVCSVLGNTTEGMKYIDYLFSFLDMLIANEPLWDDTMSFNDFEGKRSYMDIYKTSRSDWDINESNNKMHLKINPKIKIIWSDFDDKEEYTEDWATHFPDKSAYKNDYILYNGDEILKEFSLVNVDGYRATLPIPNIKTNLVKRDDYLLCRLFNISLKEFHSYMQMANLQVE